MIHTNLRQVIRNLIVEVYKGFDDTVPGPDATRHERTLWNVRARERRAHGTQTSSEIRRDRKAMQTFRAQLDPELRDAFMHGELTTLHSIAYDAVEIDSGTKVKSFTGWLRKHSNNRDQVSCIAYNRPVGTPPQRADVGSHRNSRVYREWGFVMQGYPAWIAADDAESQSHSLVPPELIAHQGASGLAKRSGSDVDWAITTPARLEEEFGWAGEVFLDNWQPIACYIHEKHATAERIADAKSTELPVYKVSTNAWQRL